MQCDKEFFFWIILAEINNLMCTEQIVIGMDVNYMVATYIDLLLFE